MYTWNQRTGFLDTLSTNAGLELVGTVLKPIVSAKNTALDFWERYLDLVGVREENERLKADLIAIQSQLVQAGEDRAELRRLRALLSLPGNRTWRPVGARVVAGRLGPNSALETVMLSRGYLTGGAPGTPIMTSQGLVGRILRASAHNATALLLTDPGSRIAVLSQDTRTPGILTGRGARHALDVRFVARNATVREGELLVTSGLDGVYPKGLPVARVVSVAPSDYSQFMSVLASPLVEVEHLEEVLLLEPTGLPPLPDALEQDDLMGPPLPVVRPVVVPAAETSPAPVAPAPTGAAAGGTAPTGRQVLGQGTGQGGQTSQPAPRQQPAQQSTQPPAEAQQPATVSQPAPRRASATQGAQGARSRTSTSAGEAIPQPPLPRQPQNFQIIPSGQPVPPASANRP